MAIRGDHPGMAKRHLLARPQVEWHADRDGGQFARSQKMRLWHRTECQSDRFLHDLPNPVSLKQIMGHDVDREQLLQELIVSFKKYYELTREGAYGDISELYFMNLYHRDGYYRFRDKEGEFEDASSV